MSSVRERLWVFCEQPRTPKEIAAFVGRDDAGSHITNMLKRGTLKRIGRGLYQATDVRHVPMPKGPSGERARRNGRRGGGIYELEDLKDRCHIETDEDDRETGCWIWKGGVSTSGGGRHTETPAVCLPLGVLGSTKRVTMSARKAAWLLAGKRLRDGHIVYRAACRCKNERCISPEHSKAGTTLQMSAEYVRSGVHRGDPRRRAIGLRNGAKTFKPIEVVRAAERMFAEGAMTKTVAAALGMAPETAANIRRGRHPFSAGRSGVPGSSVFTLRP